MVVSSRTFKSRQLSVMLGTQTQTQQFKFSYLVQFDFEFVHGEDSL